MTSTRSCGSARVFQWFKFELGLTPNDRRQRVRIEKATQLLKGAQSPIPGVALATGFSPSQYFSAVFRRSTGRSPRAYRAVDRPSAAANVGPAAKHRCFGITARA